MGKKVLVMLAEGFEEIEAITTVDILRRAELEVEVAGVGGDLIKGAHGVVVKTDTILGTPKELPDAVVLPGGVPGVNNLAASKEVNSVVKEAYEKGKLVAAICAAPSYVLAPIGILQGKKATCYPGSEGLLKGKAEFVDKRVVVDANIVTSKGPGTAFDFALKITEILAGGPASKAVGKKTLYEPC